MCAYIYIRLLRNSFECVCSVCKLDMLHEGRMQLRMQDRGSVGFQVFGLVKIG